MKLIAGLRIDIKYFRQYTFVFPGTAFPGERNNWKNLESRHLGEKGAKEDLTRKSQLATAKIIQKKL